MIDSTKFSYLSTAKSSRPTDLMPYMPVSVEKNGVSKEVLALVDTGASVNVLPYRIGIEIGAIWESQTTSLTLDGNLANYEARGLVLKVKIADFLPVNLAFAWTKQENVPVILGQMNFFLEFDLCFFRSQGFFEIKPK